VSTIESTILHSDAAPQPAGAYSQGRRIGPFVQLSGQVARDRTAGIEGQTVQVLEQLNTLLAAAGLGWPDVLMMRVFLAADEYWDGMDAAYRQVVPQPHPARTTVSVGLGDGMLVEIDALAVVP
jgi:enamine deaminase RidA (YjgF/YER057c/UK114 family)